MTLVRYELRKVWKNKFFLLALIILVCVNLFLVWTQSSPSAGRPGLDAAYRKLAVEIEPMDMAEKELYITTLYKQVEAMVTIDYVQRQTALMGTERSLWIRNQHAGVIEEYYAVYASGEYLTFTGSLAEEYRFLNSVWLEFDQVNHYGEFLAEIEAKAETLQTISIFETGENDFDGKNIRKTATDFTGMETVQPDWFPQKGLRTAIGFVMTDLILLFIMLFLSFALVRDELDTGLVFLIRATPRGRLPSALAKILALAGSLLAITLMLFGLNLLFCGLRFGLGDLWAPIQSYAFLMRSTLACNVLTYLGLFLLTKWAGVFIVGLWVLLACTLAYRASLGYLLALVFPIACELLRRLVPALSRYNLLRYANVASLIQTNEILGGYRNLNILGEPISLLIVEIIAAALFLAVFAGLFCIRLSSWQVRAIRPISAFRHTRLRTKQAPGRIGQEAYKIFAMNGGALVLFAFVALQILFTYNAESFITPREIYYRNYMQRLEGPLTAEKVDWLNEEMETFRPIFELQYKLQSGEISQQSYETAMRPYLSLEEKYNVYQEVLEKARVLGDTPGRQLVYETGYRNFFGFLGNADLVEYLTVCAALCLLCAPVFALEHRTGMRKILGTTPLGGRKTVSAKLLLCGSSALAISLLSLLLKFVVMFRDYWFSVPLAPLFSLDLFFSAPRGVPIFLLILGMVTIRAFCALMLMVVVLAISEKAGNSIVSMVLSSVMLCLAPILSLAGVEGAKWFSGYPLFHFAAMMAQPTDAAASWLYLVFWCMVGGACTYYIYDKWSVQ